MPELPIIAEINDLTMQLSTTEDPDVVEAIIAASDKFTGRVRMIYSLDGADRLLQQDIVAIEIRLQERLQKAREELRDALRALVERAKTS